MHSSRLECHPNRLKEKKTENSSELIKTRANLRVDSNVQAEVLRKRQKAKFLKKKLEQTCRQLESTRILSESTQSLLANSAKFQKYAELFLTASFCFLTTRNG